MRTCTKCKITKPLNAFNADRRNGQAMSRCKDCRREECKSWRKSKPNYEKERYQADKVGAWKRHIKRKLGITDQEYQELLAKQEGRCAICRNGITAKRLDIDHNHSTKEVRGLLCSNCNRMIGYAKDSEAILTSAINYLQSYRKSRSKSSKRLTRSKEAEKEL